jgi:hypothetical protein
MVVEDSRGEILFAHFPSTKLHALPILRVFYAANSSLVRSARCENILMDDSYLNADSHDGARERARPKMLSAELLGRHMHEASNGVAVLFGGAEFPTLFADRMVVIDLEKQLALTKSKRRFDYTSYSMNLVKGLTCYRRNATSGNCVGPPLCDSQSGS